MPLNKIQQQMLEQQVQDRLNKVDEHTTQLAENTKKFTSVVFVENFSKQGNETDDTERIKRALSALVSSGGGKLIFAGYSYTISSQIDVPSNVTFRGIKGKTKIDASTLPAGTALNQIIAFNLYGSIAGGISVTGDVAQWANVFTLTSTVGLQKGDLILISNNEAYAPGTTATTWKKGELLTIKSIDSATQITTDEKTIFVYASGQGTKIQKITPVQNVTFRGIEIVLGGVGKAHTAIRAFHVKDILLQDVTIDGAEDTGLNIYAGYNIQIKYSHIKNSTSSQTLGNTGYGIGISAARNVLITKNTFTNCRHGVAGGGDYPAIWIDVKGNYGYQCSQYAFDCHEPTFFWTFKGNTAISCYGGIVARGQHITIEGNTAVASLDSGILIYSFTPVTEQFNVVVRNNKIRKSVNQGIYVNGSNSLIRDLIVSGNVVEEAGGYGIEVYNFKGAKVNDNEVLNSANGIHIFGVSTTSRSEDLQVHSNKVRDSALHGIYIYACRDVSILSPVIERPSGGIGVYLNDCINTETIGGIIRGSKSYGIQIQNGSEHTINGTKIYDCIDATSDAIRVISTSDLTIVNTLTKNNPRYGIYITGTNYVVLTGNNARGNANATKILVDAAATSIVNQNNLIA